jgi:hypothetical protein
VPVSEVVFGFSIELPDSFANVQLAERWQTKLLGFGKAMEGVESKQRWKII